MKNKEKNITREFLNLLDGIDAKERAFLLTIAAIDDQNIDDALKIVDYITSMVIGKCAFTETKDNNFTDYQQTLHNMTTHHVSNLVRVFASEGYNDRVFELSQLFESIGSEGDHDEN